MLRSSSKERLNLFFIRSRILAIKKRKLYGQPPRVLIPFLSGLGFWQNQLGGRFPRGGLNPFFIRSRILANVMVMEKFVPWTRLNPFFIRSRILANLYRKDLWGNEVLIPSLSGLGFWHATDREVQGRADGLNPFFIRSRILAPLLRDGQGSPRVLIPSLSGLGFWRRTY